jgi:hypothetical protein
VTSPASGAGSAADLPDGVCQSKFLTTRDGVVLSDVPPSVGHNLPKEGTDASDLAAGRLTRDEAERQQPEMSAER